MSFMISSEKGVSMNCKSFFHPQFLPFAGVLLLAFFVFPVSLNAASTAPVLTLAKTESSAQNADALAPVAEQIAKYKKYGFSFDQKMKIDSALKGKTPESEELLKELQLLFETLDMFPPELIRKIGVKKFNIYSEMTCDGEEVDIMRRGDRMFMNSLTKAVDMAKLVYSGMNNTVRDKKWRSFNDKSFTYIHETNFANDKTKVSAITHSPEKNKDFAHAHGMFNEQLDRSETFAALILSGEALMKKAEKSSILKAKIDFIIEDSVEHHQLTMEYWEKLIPGLAQENEKKNAGKYPSSLAKKGADALAGTK